MRKIKSHRGKIVSIVKIVALGIFFLMSVNIEAYSATELTKDEALQSLKAGNERFVTGKREFPNLDMQRRAYTSENGQHPFATVITCSDSRVPVEHAFDVGVGDVFVIRVAGNVVDVDEAGSIEYGIEHLHTPVFVVLGHSGCGAVTAVCRGDEVHGNIPKLVDNIIPATEKAKKELGGTFNEALLELSIKNNVWKSIEDLLKVSPVTAELVESGKLKIVGAVYHLKDGHVEWLGEHPRQQALLNESAKNHEAHNAGAAHFEKDETSFGNQEMFMAVSHTKQSNQSTLFIALILISIMVLIYFLIINNQTALKLNLKGKILSVAISITVLLIMIAGTNYFFLRGIGNEIESIAKEDIVLTETTAEIEKHALQQELTLQKIITLFHDGIYLNENEIKSLEDEFNGLSEEIDEHLDESVQLCQNVLNHENDERQLAEFGSLFTSFKKLDKTHDKFEKNAEVFFQAVNNNNGTEVNNSEHALEAEAENIAKVTAGILENIEKFTEASSMKAMEDESRAIMTNIIVAAIAIILSLMLGTIISNKITGQLGGEPEEVAEISNNIARGNLAFDISRFNGRSGAMQNMTNMVTKLKEIVANILQGSENIASASQQMSSSSEEMSQGASEQASSVEEVSSTMEEIAANIEQNTENSQQTEKISVEANESMLKVAERSQKSVDANKEIANKITIINDIAFQTNILALNAAVEAARAGEHGKGFAVVAAEVRKLAERSKVAAEEIVALAQNSLELSQGAGELMNATIPKIENTTQLVQEISTASLEQSNGANQVNDAIQQLSGVTQSNAAVSEELATSAEELSAQAEQLRGLVSFFNIGEQHSVSNLKNPKKVVLNKPDKQVDKKAINSKENFVAYDE